MVNYHVAPPPPPPSILAKENKERMPMPIQQWVLYLRKSLFLPNYNLFELFDPNFDYMSYLKNYVFFLLCLALVIFFANNLDLTIYVQFFLNKTSS
jgi:hypothetical protein